MRATQAVVDLAAVSRNVRTLVDHVAPVRMCAVVKADGYGHGLVPVARAALSAGASQLAVALVEEGMKLRDAGVAGPILLLSEPTPGEMLEVVEAELTPTVYTGGGVTAAAAAADQAGRPLPVHVGVNTGMNRVGIRPEGVPEIVAAINDRSSLALEGIWTHCAVADEPDNPFTTVQLERFAQVVADVRAGGNEVIAHAGNSAVALIRPDGLFDMVRCGIACYGLPPAPALGDVVPLEPAMSLFARVAFVKTVPAGEAISYGQRYRCESDTIVATVPIGYADGVRRSSFAHGVEVLVGGARCKIVGTVTMDQIMIDCTPYPEVAVGDEVMLIGTQGDDTITATEIGERLGTISYEIVCGLGPRVRRTYR